MFNPDIPPAPPSTPERPGLLTLMRSPEEYRQKLAVYDQAHGDMIAYMDFFGRNMIAARRSFDQQLARAKAHQAYFEKSRLGLPQSALLRNMRQELDSIVAGVMLLRSRMRTSVELRILADQFKNVLDEMETREERLAWSRPTILFELVYNHQKITEDLKKIVALLEAEVPARPNSFSQPLTAQMARQRLNVFAASMPSIEATVASAPSDYFLHTMHNRFKDNARAVSQELYHSFGPLHVSYTDPNGAEMVVDEIARMALGFSRILNPTSRTAIELIEISYPRNGNPPLLNEHRQRLVDFLNARPDVRRFVLRSVDEIIQERNRIIIESTDSGSEIVYLELEDPADQLVKMLRALLVILSISTVL